ncbi:hypothetical protein PDJ95_14585 [Bacillus cereus]|uniref:Group-specific protein n=2 Tax=Bacillus thuringiensis TaxID=1428 RepID=A0A9X7ANM1_BACTU|nr:MULTISPECIES: hypothetical protein [Bacillus cereus group]MCQ6332678.1 hypothetical protein [Bacillus cereus]MDA1772600.1 hypothetical protein [Bacillus cereus]MED3319971.1 hypothetical protein [Bacillus thuringiensis]OUB61293.1 hypothetical protein BK716_01420 [Bacillus thuringiensis serovar higo]PEM06110.1 hypothetical protein CN602_01760 [Bacillus cereus]
MLTWIMIVVLLVVITVIATVLIGRNGDANYSKATKGNIKRLTMIYIILAVVLVVGLGVYIYFKS